MTSLAEARTAKDVVNAVTVYNRIAGLELAVYSPTIGEFYIPTELCTKLFPVHAPDFLSTETGALAAKYCTPEMDTLAVTSRVIASYRRLHIPQIDFAGGVWELEDCQNLGRFLKELGQEGYLLDSGRSYQWYGLDLMNEGSWQDFMNGLAGSDMVDFNWVDMSVDRGFTALRISSSSIKPVIPFVVGKFFEEKKFCQNTSWSFTDS